MAHAAAVQLASFVSLLALLAGCLSPGPAPAALEAADETSRPVVVALMDTGINPYHEAFRALPGRGAELWADEFGAEVVNLTQEGDYWARVAADEALWASMEPNQLYAFAGTRALGISISREGEPILLDTNGHGTGTASIASREDPEALVVMVQIDPRTCDPFADHCPILVATSAGMAWIAEQPWIDVVSVSMGYPGNPPLQASIAPDVAPYIEASRLAYERGKIIVNSAGNEVASPLVSYFAGVPWVIAVGGFEPDPQGESVSAGKLVDVVANFTEEVALGESVDAVGAAIGTSFGTPLVAGTLSRALGMIRQENSADRPPPELLRAALNASAVYVDPLDWDPTSPPSNSTTIFIWNPHAPILLPPVQMGWGYVHGGLAEEITRRVLENDLEPPAEKQQTAQYMAQWQALRGAYWRQMSS